MFIIYTINTLWQHLRCRRNSPEHVHDTFSRRWHGHAFETQSIQRGGPCVVGVLWLNSWQWPDPKLPTREHLPVYLICVRVLYCHLSQNPTHLQFMNTYRYVYVNTLWPSDVIRRLDLDQPLAQVMACCLTAPSHYLNKCWLVMTSVLWHSPGSKFHPWT